MGTWEIYLCICSNLDLNLDISHLDTDFELPKNPDIAFNEPNSWEK